MNAVLALFKNSLGGVFTFFTSDIFRSILFILLIGGGTAVLGKCTFDSVKDWYQARHDNTVSVLKDANKQADVALEKQAQAQQVDNATVDQVITKKEERQQAADDLTKRKNTRIEKIRTKYKSKIEKAKNNKDPTVAKQQVELTMQEQDVEISKAQISHLWGAYCQATNQSALTCVPAT